MNDRLRATLRSSTFSENEFAERMQVDPKTVQRWIATGRTPHRRTAQQAAEMLGVPMAWLWPNIDADNLRPSAASEVVALYPHRAQVPKHLWVDQLVRAKRKIDIFTYAGLFLAEETGDAIELIRFRAASGTRVRIALGDPDSPELALRGVEEGLGEQIAARVRMSLSYFSPLVGEPGIAFHLHRTTLYNSFYRFDAEMLINQHAYGAYGYQAPILHLRETPNAELFPLYERSLERAWANSYPFKVTPSDQGAPQPVENRHEKISVAQVSQDVDSTRTL